MSKGTKIVLKNRYSNEYIIKDKKEIVTTLDIDDATHFITERNAQIYKSQWHLWDWDILI